jgi:Tfp pilus assembly protein PilN
VNLYREREERALQFRQGLVRGVVLGVVAGLEILLIAMLLVSGQQLKNQADRIRTSVTALETRMGPRPDNQELHQLRTLIRSRVDREDWASTLSAVAAAVPPGLLLTEVQGGVGTQRGSINGLELKGRLEGTDRDLAVVFAFIAALEADSVIATRFPVVDLGTAQGRGNSFQIICRPGRRRAGS